MRWAVGSGVPVGRFGLGPLRLDGVPSALGDGTGPRCVLRRRGDTRLGFERRARGTDAGEPLLLVGHPVRHLIAAPFGPVLAILAIIGVRCRVEPGLHLRGQFGFHLLHARIAHGLVLGGVGAQLGPVHRHMAEAHQTRPLAQRQHLNEQLAQRRQVAAAELADGAEVRPVTEP